MWRTRKSRLWEMSCVKSESRRKIRNRRRMMVMKWWNIIRSWNRSRRMMVMRWGIGLWVGIEWVGVEVWGVVGCRGWWGGWRRCWGVGRVDGELIGNGSGGNASASRWNEGCFPHRGLAASLGVGGGGQFGNELVSPLYPLPKYSNSPIVNSYWAW